MKRFLSLCLLLFPLISSACLYDYKGLKEYCDGTNTPGTTFLQCPNVLDGKVVGCNYEYIKDPNFPNEQACTFGSHERFFLRCPEGSVPDPSIDSARLKNRPCNDIGSIVHIDNQSFSEVVPLVGIPFNLVYTSDRVKGRKSWNKINIPFSGSGSVESYNNFKTEIYINDVLVQSVSNTPTANFVKNFVWDGKDASGNPILGSANVRIDRIYGTNCGNSSKKLKETRPVEYAMTCLVYGQNSSFNFILGLNYAENIGLGGWTLNILHSYDPLRKVLFLGNGSTFNVNYKTLPDGTNIVVSEDRSEVYIFDSNFRHIRTKESLTGAAIFAFTYDSNGKIISVGDVSNNLTTFQYSGSNIQSITSPWGQVTDLTIDSFGYLSSVTNPANETYEFTSAEDGLMLSFKQPSGVISTFSYDDLGKLLADESTAGNKIQIYPGPANSNLLYSESLGRVTQHSFASNGRTTTSPSGYNSTSLEKSDGGYTITESGFSFNSSGIADARFGNVFKMFNSANITDGAQNATVSRTESTQLSDSTDPFSVISTSSSSTLNGKTTLSNYDGITRTLVETTPSGIELTSTFDDKGRPKTYRHGNLKPMAIGYDTRGRVKRVMQTTDREYIFAYDNGNDFASSITNPLGQVTSFEYDGAGRVITQTLPDTRVIGFTYDVNGNMTSVTPPGKPAHNMEYNGHNLMSYYIPPTIAAPTGNTTFTYNNHRELTQVQRPNGDLISFNYGTTNGNLNSITFGPYSRSFTYSSGVLSSAVSEDTFYRYFYFSGRQLTGEYNYIPPMAYTINYNLNSDMRLSVENVAVGSTTYNVNYSYDDDGQIIQANDLYLSHAPLTGLLTQRRLRSSKVQYTNSPFGEVSTILSLYADTTTTYQSSFVRDNLGRITSQTEQYNSSPSNQYDFTYDSAGRLTDVTLNGSPKSHYVYDSNSNRISQTIDGVTTNATYDDQDRLVSFGNVSYSYNANGELTNVVNGAGATIKTYSYDAFGNLKSVVSPARTVTYKVDANNRRVIKYVDGVVWGRYIWNANDQLIAMADENGVITKRFVYATQSHVPDYMFQGTAQFHIIKNHLGSPVQVINAKTGEMVQEIAYDEFGKILSDSRPNFTPFGFAGCLYDNHTKLCKFGARDYDASIGRWLSKDPILFGGGDTNLYGYVFQDPINFIDPFGTDAWRTNAGHGYLVIDNPSRTQGGHFVFTYGPKDGSASYFKSLLGMTVPAAAEVAFFPKGSDLSFLGIEVPFSRLNQNPYQDQQTLNRALDFAQRTNQGQNSYNLYQLGDGLNCIGAARGVQCGCQ